MVSMRCRRESKLKGIYRITHIPTGRHYVGQSFNMRQRWISHKSLLNTSNHSNQFLQKAWKETNISEWEFVTVEECPPESAITFQGRRHQSYCHCPKCDSGDRKVREYLIIREHEWSIILHSYTNGFNLPPIRYSDNNPLRDRYLWSINHTCDDTFYFNMSSDRLLFQFEIDPPGELH